MVPYQPSPSTSDLPIPSDDADIHVEVDHEGIQFRYAEMKRLSRKVLCSFFIFPFFWICAPYLFIILCVFFWYAEGGGQGEQQTEIRIVMRNGLPPA